MTRTPHHLAEPSSERRQRLQLAVEEVTRQIAGGHEVPDEDLLARYPDLASDLRDALRKTRQIHAAFRVVDEQQAAFLLDRLQRPDSRGEEGATEPLTGTAEEVALPSQIGRYRTERLIGQGGFGKVILAWDEELTRRVAIKIPHRHRLSDLESVAAYLAEARVVAKLDHPGIVPVYDVGRTPDGGCYVVSKWVSGGDLATRLRQSRLSQEDAIALVIELAAALHYAHSQGIIHRDVKPANILLDRDDSPCLVDFGLAVSDEEWSEAWRWAGTPAYMSPEQVRGEAHRIDHRSDIFSLGVVLYECLAGERPFAGLSQEQVLEAIVTREPRPLRELDPSIAVEVERICWKALSKRAADRYPTAREFMLDLRHFQRRDLGTTVDLVGQGRSVPAPAPAAAPIVPKGLRCFDASDAAFFGQLLPGPRDRHGLPESIRQWKVRIEQSDADESFPVGLLYGPSGCGKSSFVRAGLLPQLHGSIEWIYLDATPDETEAQLLKRLQAKYPTLPVEGGLAKCFAAIRRGSGPGSPGKLLVVIDQFEQWLSGRSDGERRSLVESLRQCDGPRLQCLLLVRDDFWLDISRFMAELEVELVQGRTTSLVDLFDPIHARKVMLELGRAYGRLPEEGRELSPIQHEFLDRAVASLNEDGKIIPVRLALFVEMFKGREWTPAALKHIGGSHGVGVMFLEETFCSRTANPRNRRHERAARAVLEALLPRPGSPIKGHVRSYPELLDLSGYGHAPRDFKDLMRILDGETRLLTPADRVGGPGPADSAARPVSYYQLTHDYLVPALREWLTKKQRATRSGRAVLNLAERTALWQSTQERRQLPSLWEWWSIRFFTRPSTWSDAQRRMMRVAAFQHASWGLISIAMGLMLLLTGAELTTSARSLFLRIRASTVPVWLVFGQEEALFPLLQADEDPTVRTQLIHRLSPLWITSERLVQRAREVQPSAVRRGLLLAAGEMLQEPARGGRTPAEGPRRPVAEAIIRDVTELYLRDPDPGVHAAAEWVLRQSLTPWELARLQGLVRSAPPTDRRWYVAANGHTLMVIPGPAPFRMGSPEPDGAGDLAEPQHDQLIRRSFSVASQETTVAQFEQFLASGPADVRQTQRGTTVPDHPALQVSWYQAAAYCNWLSERDEIPPDQWCFRPNNDGEYAAGMSLAPQWQQLRGYRLPTEAEWEYACRAGTSTNRYFGSDPEPLGEYAHGAPWASGAPAAVAARKPNDFGLFDSLGNAAEWCLDRYRPDRGERDPGWERVGEEILGTEARMIRGGSYRDLPAQLTAYHRLRMLPAQTASTVGFRVARSYP